MSLDPQVSFSAKARIVLPGSGGKITEVITGNSTPTTLSGYTYDMSRCRSFSVTQEQSTSGGSFSGTFLIEQKLGGEWIALGSAVTVGTTTTYFETAERGYGKIRVNPAALQVTTNGVTLTLTFTGYRAGAGF